MTLKLAKETVSVNRSVNLLFPRSRIDPVRLGDIKSDVTIAASNALLNAIPAIGLPLVSCTASNSTVKNVLPGVVAKLSYLLIALRSSMDISITKISGAVIVFTIL